MALKVRKVDFNPDEWIAGTIGMTPEEEGIYIRIIARIYSRGEGLPADPTELAHICGIRPQFMRRILPKLLPKFEQTDGKLRSNRCETEIKLARNRIETARLNGVKGGKSKGLAKPSVKISAKATSTTTIGKEEGLSPKELNPVFLTAPGGSPPLPSRGDGVAAPGATTSSEAEPDPPTAFEDPALRADAIAAFDRCLAAVRGKLPVLDAEATVPPADPRLVQFRARLQRLNTVASERLGGNTRLQAWETIAAADALGDPLALSPDMLAGLDAIESLEPCAEAAE